MVALAFLELTDETLCSGVWPGDGVVQRLSSLGVPNQSCFSLVGKANGLDVRGLVAQLNELLGSLFDTSFYRVNELPRVVLVPTVNVC